MLFMQRADEIAELRAEDPFERPLFRRNDMHLDLASAQRRGDFEADEACADHDGALAVSA